MDLGIIKVYSNGSSTPTTTIKFDKTTFSRGGGKSEDNLEFEDSPIIEVGNERISPLWGLIYYATYRYLPPEVTADEFFNASPADPEKRTKFGDHIDGGIKPYTLTYVRIYEHNLGSDPDRYKDLVEKSEQIGQFVDKQIRFYEELERKFRAGEEISPQFILENTLLDKEWVKNTFKTYLLLRNIPFPHSHDGRGKVVLDNILENYSKFVADLLRDELSQGGNVKDKIVEKVKSKFGEELLKVKDKDLRNILFGFKEFIQNILGLVGLVSNPKNLELKEYTPKYLSATKEFLKSVKYYIDNYIKNGKVISIESSFLSYNLRLEDLDEYPEFQKLDKEKKFNRLEEIQRDFGEGIFQILDKIYENQYGYKYEDYPYKKLQAIKDITKLEDYNKLLDRLYKNYGIDISKGIDKIVGDYTFIPIVYPPSYNPNILAFHSTHEGKNTFVIKNISKQVWESIEVYRGVGLSMLGGGEVITNPATKIDSFFGNFGSGYKPNSNDIENLFEKVGEVIKKSGNISPVDWEKIQRGGVGEFLKTFLPSPQFWYEDYIRDGDYTKVVVPYHIPPDESTKFYSSNPLFRILYNIPIFFAGHIDEEDKKYYKYVGIVVSSGLSRTLNKFLKNTYSDFIAHIESNKESYQNLLEKFTNGETFDETADALYDFLIPKNQPSSGRGKGGRRKGGKNKGLLVTSLNKILTKFLENGGKNVEHVILPKYIVNSNPTSLKYYIVVNETYEYMNKQLLAHGVNIEDGFFPYPTLENKDQLKKFFGFTRDTLIGFFRFILGDYTSPDFEVLKKLSLELKRNGYTKLERKVKINYKTELPDLIDRVLEFFENNKDKTFWGDTDEFVRTALKFHPIGNLILITLHHLYSSGNEDRLKKFIETLKEISSEIRENPDSVDKDYDVEMVLDAGQLFYKTIQQSNLYVSTSNPVIRLFSEIYRSISKESALKLPEHFYLFTALFFDSRVVKIPHMNPIIDGIVRYNLLTSYMNNDFINFIEWFKLYGRTFNFISPIPVGIGWVVKLGIGIKPEERKELKDFITKQVMSILGLSNIFTSFIHNISEPSEFYTNFNQTYLRNIHINTMNILKTGLVDNLSNLIGELERENKYQTKQGENYIYPTLVTKNLLEPIGDVTSYKINGIFEQLYFTTKVAIGDMDGTLEYLINETTHRQGIGNIISRLVDYTLTKEEDRNIFKKLLTQYNGYILSMEDIFKKIKSVDEFEVNTFGEILLARYIADTYYGLIFSSAPNSPLKNPDLNNLSGEMTKLGRDLMIMYTHQLSDLGKESFGYSPEDLISELILKNFFKKDFTFLQPFTIKSGITNNLKRGC